MNIQIEELSRITNGSIFSIVSAIDEWSDADTEYDYWDQIIDLSSALDRCKGKGFSSSFINVAMQELRRMLNTMLLKFDLVQRDEAYALVPVGTEPDLERVSMHEVAEGYDNFVIEYAEAYYADVNHSDYLNIQE